MCLLNKMSNTFTMTLLNKTVVGLVLIIGVVNAGALIGNSTKPTRKSVEISYPPTGDYTSYRVTVNPDGSYSIDYKRHDPTVLDAETYTDTSNGVFGIGGRSELLYDQVRARLAVQYHEGKHNMTWEEQHDAAEKVVRIRAIQTRSRWS